MTTLYARIEHRARLLRSHEPATFSLVRKNESAPFVETEPGPMFCRCARLVSYKFISIYFVDQPHHLVLFWRVNDVGEPAVLMKGLRDMPITRLRRWIIRVALPLAN